MIVFITYIKIDLNHRYTYLKMTNPNNSVFCIRVGDDHIVINVPDFREQCFYEILPRNLAQLIMRYDHGTSIVVFSDGYEDDDTDCARDLLATLVVNEVMVDTYVVSDEYWNYIVIDDFFADDVITLIRSVLDD